MPPARGRRGSCGGMRKRPVMVMSAHEPSQAAAQEPTPVYRRVLLKVSGEALMGEGEYGIDYEAVKRIAEDIKDVHALSVEVCLVIGGGNIFRGVSGATLGMARANADYMGMMATVINALALQSAMEQADVPTRVLSAIPMDTICEPYIRRRAIRHMETGRAVIFAAGTGNPFFTTDTTAALRAAEMGCEALFSARRLGDGSSLGRGVAIFPARAAARRSGHGSA